MHIKKCTREGITGKLLTIVRLKNYRGLETPRDIFYMQGKHVQFEPLKTLLERYGQLLNIRDTNSFASTTVMKRHFCKH